MTVEKRSRGWGGVNPGWSRPAPSRPRLSGATPDRVAPLTPPLGRASAGSARARAACFRPAGDSRGAPSGRRYGRIGKREDEAADVLLPSRAAWSRSDLRVRKLGVRRGRRRGAGSPWSEVRGLRGQRSRRGRGAGGARRASQPRSGQKGCGFIHSRALGRRPAPSRPESAALLECPPA